MKKIILLFTILTSITLYPHTKEELEQQITEKLKSMTALGEKITQQEELLESLKIKIFEIYNKCIAREKTKEMTNEQIKQLEEQLDNNWMEFQDNYFKSIKENTKNNQAPLTNEYLANEKTYGHHFRGLLKFYAVRKAFEHTALIMLLVQWESLLNEWYELNEKLAALEKVQ